MSLEVRDLVKVYGSQRAVDGISFQAQPGEVVGFLGPNGAGKSTTMKIATGYLMPSFGEVFIKGISVQEKPLAVRKLLGYLPEHNPLYLDMYVHEYLRFIGKLHGLQGKALSTRVGEVISLVGLTREQNKRIQSLSKGYRQRVGLAQALVHNPEVLILDEPTTGLDPNQIQEIRQVIRQISQEKTVLFSTHIMQEVQALCNRVIIISQGQLLIDSPIANLGQYARAEVEVEFEAAVPTEALAALPGVEHVEELPDFRYRLPTSDPRNLRRAVYRQAIASGWPLIGLRQSEQSLEQIFQELTLRPE
jgi:ABC-2 type transport system ATP-binding protein